MSSPRLGVRPPLRPLSLLFKRWLLSASLVFGTYNPSGFSYLHWVWDSPELTSEHFFVGILLVSVVMAIARMAFLSLGYFGITAALAGIVMSYALGAGLDLFALADVEFTTYTLLFWITGVLAVGTSWSFFQERISGERDILRQPP
ncbi:DUF6524 family protein [Azospirillum sp. SYSU D00513]|uniref:DUF6524 family protein n=1 Tax=Azospirillum sp. SYSU D00513 TaxID=2812561 RepID=UPI001A978CE1|nr:DUF6524 family protein [Azospirillum sp. SYSU D00513]